MAATVAALVSSTLHSTVVFVLPISHHSWRDHIRTHHFS